MAEAKKRLILIDGHALAYRMFFAPFIPDLRTASGEPTRATYGFTQQMLNIINDPNPADYLAVSFDVGDTFRNEMFAEYKGTRERMPDDLELQIGRIHDVLNAMNIPILEVDGYEADDVLGTISRIAEGMGLETMILTGDRDLLQLVTEHVKIELPGRTPGSKGELFDPQKVFEKYGVRPDQFVDYKALIGDTSDNIPGVKGIGEKSAAPLLQKYESLDGIYEHLDEVMPKGNRAKLEAGRESAYLSQKLSRIVLDVPLEFDIEKCVTHDFDRTKVLELFRTLEFRRFADQIRGTSSSEPAAPSTGQMSMFDPQPQAAAVIDTPEPTGAPTNAICVQDEAALDALIAKLEAASVIAFDTETTSTDQMQAKLVGISVAVEEGEGYYIPVGHIDTEEAQLPMELVIERLRPVMTNPDVQKVAHNIKYDAVVLKRHGLEVSPLSFDTMIAQWLVRPDGFRSGLGLKAQAWERFNVQMTEIEELIGKGKNQITMDRVSVEKCSPYAAADADVTLRLVTPMRAELVTQGVERLFHDHEMPLVPVLRDMEIAGALIDVAVLNEMSVELTKTLEGLVQQIYDKCGYAFNLNSPEQLSKALFDDLGLSTDGIQKTGTKKFYSTAVATLDILEERDTTGVIALIKEYRELEKLRSTYVDALPLMVNPETGRIHGEFDQVGAITGRLSSKNPNLQNIPIRTEIGRKVRNAFIAPPGCKLIAGDYSQVELRIMAHVSGDPYLINAFREDQDIHASTAAAVRGVPVESISRDERNFAKRVNFGLLYGMGAHRLARESNMPFAEAQAFINRYFEQFAHVKQYFEGTKQQAIEDGYVETVMGRRRYFPILRQGSGGSQNDRARAEREAINMPIQGTAAEIMKIAMVRLHKAIADAGLNGRLILQVHDELVFEMPDAEVEQTAAMIKDIMETAYPMDVPLKVDVHVGQNWGAMKG